MAKGRHSWGRHRGLGGAVAPNCQPWIRHWTGDDCRSSTMSLVIACTRSRAEVVTKSTVNCYEADDTCHQVVCEHWLYTPEPRMRDQRFRGIIA